MKFLGKEVTPERVKAAYTKTGLRPFQGDWVEMGLDDAGKATVKCGCAATAMLLAETDVAWNDLSHYCDFVPDTPHWFKDVSINFLRGFDGEQEYFDKDSQAFKLASGPEYELGKACWEAVRGQAEAD
jgi:hypothetical protein